MGGVLGSKDTRTSKVQGRCGHRQTASAPCDNVSVEGDIAGDRSSESRPQEGSLEEMIPEFILRD